MAPSAAMAPEFLTNFLREIDNFFGIYVEQFEKDKLSNLFEFWEHLSDSMFMNHEDLIEIA